MSGYPPIKTVVLQAAEVEISLAEALRYMGLGRAEPDEGVVALAEDAVALIRKTARYAACSLVVPVTIRAEGVDLGVFRVTSASLAKHLAGCDAAVLFAATTGMELERRRKQAIVTSGARALALDLDPIFVGAHHLARLLGLSLALPVVISALRQPAAPSDESPRSRNVRGSSDRRPFGD